MRVEDIVIDTEFAAREPAVDERRAMLAAGEEILECCRVLRKAGLNLVGEMRRGQGDFVELDHYPRDDVFDGDTPSKYDYHAHRGMAGEHGHFHTFVRAPGMPPGMRPIDYKGTETWPAGRDALSHLIGISMDAYGFPTGLFTTNRWVTVAALLERRDAVIAEWAQRRPGTDVFEARELEITSQTSISVEDRIAHLRALLKQEAVAAQSTSARAGSR